MSSPAYPVTVVEKIPVTNTPNISSYKSYVFAKNPALVQRFIKATKADVGGGGADAGKKPVSARPGGRPDEIDRSG